MDLFSGGRNIKPTSSIYLRKLSHHPRSPRPLHGELIAHRLHLIQILFHRPGKDDLSAGLLYPSQLYELPLNIKARLFSKLPLCCLQQAFTPSASPLEMDQAASSFPAQKGPPGCTSMTSSRPSLNLNGRIPQLFLLILSFIYILNDGSFLFLSSPSGCWL